jgi:hypothetical protein
VSARDERQQIALLGRLNGDEAHSWSLHCLGDGLGIAVVVLVSFEKRLDVLGGDQANVVPEWLNLARDVMRARAGLQADKAGREIDEPADRLVARYLDAHGDGAALIEADEVKGVLADVEADVATGSDDF